MFGGIRGEFRDGEDGLENTHATDVPAGVTGELENTGERFLPGADNSAEMAYDHVARYRLVERYVRGKDVVDMGCGAGYGSHYLSRLAKTVRGVDLSGEAIAFAVRRYRAPNLGYGVGDVTRLPYEDGSFEAAISFEVIEHLEDPEDLVREAGRVVRDDGLFVVSTPDKQTYSNDRNSVNPFHVSEMYPQEFREILERHFDHVSLYRQGGLAGSMILPEDGLKDDGRVVLETAQFSLEDPGFSLEAPATLYLIAVCTNGTPPETLDRPYIFVDRDRQVFEEAVEWTATATQIKMYYNRRHREENRKLNRANEQLKRVRDELRAARRELDAARQETRVLRNSRSWALARRISGVANRARGLLGRG